MSFPKPFKEFDSKFSFSQWVHGLRKKLYHACLLLEKTLDALASLIVHTGTVSAVLRVSETFDDELQHELDNLRFKLKGHLTTANKLLHVSEDIRFMIRSIPAPRIPSSSHVELVQLADGRIARTTKY